MVSINQLLRCLISFSMKIRWQKARRSSPAFSRVLRCGLWHGGRSSSTLMYWSWGWKSFLFLPFPDLSLTIKCFQRHHRQDPLLRSLSFQTQTTKVNTIETLGRQINFHGTETVFNSLFWNLHWPVDCFCPQASGLIIFLLIA